MTDERKPLAYFVTSHPMSVVAFLLPHLKALSSHVRLRVLANTSDTNLLISRGLNLPVGDVAIERAIRPWKDLLALWSLYQTFRVNKPDAVHTITPKAGLLGMAAAWLARVPVRVHSFTGQVWVTQTGLMKHVLMWADRCIAALATDVLVDSPSQRDFLLKHGIVTSEKSDVLGPGSICGVDTARFTPDLADRIALRAELGIEADSKVLLYLGRLNHDKGVLDLADAFFMLAKSNQRLVLLMVGPDEAGISEQIAERCGEKRSRLIRVGFTNTPERYMRVADLFCLPSYREGFGSSVIEAASCGVPAVTSRIYGLTDAVVEGATGWLHEPGDVNDLSDTIAAALADSAHLKQMGAQAREHAVAVFAQEKITGAMVAFYVQRLSTGHAA
jgi:glycosyltransferase involved in cell wall biosynthesis